MRTSPPRRSMSRCIVPVARIVCAVLVALTAQVTAASAVKTAAWEVGGVLDFERCQSIDIAITADGIARLAPERELLFDPSQAYAWCLAEGADGTIYAGTGDDGMIVAIPPVGEPFVLYDSIELQILSMVVGPDGAIYAGGSPDGVILRVAPDGTATTFLDTPETYVWALGFDAAGVLYAATGDNGRLYRIPAAGQGEVYLDTDETHLLCMEAFDGGWALGTSPGGLVLQVAAQDSALVRYDADEEEVKTLASTEDGTLYFGTVGDPTEGMSSESINGIPVISIDGSGGSGSSVYRMTPDGAVQSLWQSSEGLVLAIEPDGNGGLWVGTGDRGALYQLDGRGTPTRMFETEESQVISLLHSDRGGLIAGTANLAGIYRVGPSVEVEGYLTSDIFDARNVAAWGRVRWQATVPPGGAIRLQTRTGNTEYPDGTWSGWSDPLRDPGGEIIASPAARYVQWRARLLGSGSGSPQLESVTVAYLEHNLPPRVHAVDVVATEGDFVPIEYDYTPERVQQTLPSGVQVEFAFPSSMRGSLRIDQVSWLRSTRVASWVADDPNGDQLLFDLFIKGEHDRQWRLLAEEVLDQIYAFRTADLADGRYKLKVQASDGTSNPRGWALSDSLASRAFVVDNTPPDIRGLRAQRRLEGDLLVTCTVVDDQSILAGFEYSLNAGDWQTVFPEDTIFDTADESFLFTIDVDDVADEHVVLVRAADDAGNVSARRVVVP